MLAKIQSRKSWCWTQCLKIFYRRNLQLLVISYSVCHRQTFPAKYLGLRPGVHALVRFSLTCKQYTRMERNIWDKRSSLLWTFVNYDRKMFYNIGPRTQCYKTFVVKFNIKLDRSSLFRDNQPVSQATMLLSCRALPSNVCSYKHSSLLPENV
jgi:hypothetical protein